MVTGGGTGIGLMITQALQANGARVYITGRRTETLDRVVERYSTGPGTIVALPGDVSSKDEAVRLAASVERREKERGGDNGIQLLVNNAGIARDDATKYCECWVPSTGSRTRRGAGEGRERRTLTLVAT